MITKPLNGYVILSRCSTDPTLSFQKPGGMVPTTASDMTKGPYMLPAVVVAISKVNHLELSVGDVVYVNPMFCFQNYIEGGIFMSVHEDHIFQVLPAAEAEARGVKAVDCRDSAQLITTPKIQVANREPVLAR